MDFLQELNIILKIREVWRFRSSDHTDHTEISILKDMINEIKSRYGGGDTFENMFNLDPTMLVRMSRFESRDDSISTFARYSLAILKNRFKLDDDIEGAGKYKYDVFVSFASEDDQLKKDIIRLDAALMKNCISTFRPNEFISGQLPHLQEPPPYRTCIVILSKSYLSSKWGLCELEQIIERHISSKLGLILVYYDITYEYLKTERIISIHEEKVKRWRSAVDRLDNKKATNISETFDIHKIIKGIQKILDPPATTSFTCYNIINIMNLLIPDESNEVPNDNKKRDTCEGSSRLPFQLPPPLQILERPFPSKQSSEKITFIPQPPERPSEIQLEDALQSGMVNLRGCGRSLKNNVLDILVNSFREPGIDIVGLYGNAGVGKTTLMQGFKDLPAVRNMFDSVTFLTLDKDRSHTSFIAHHPQRKDVEASRFDSLLILDNVNRYVDLKALNIAEATPHYSQKIVIMSRFEKVCDSILTDLKICLEDFICWTIFVENVGGVDGLSLQEMARKISGICSPSEHATILMARALRDVYDTDVWSTALEMLSKQPPGQLQDLLLSILKFCYESLDDNGTRECLRSSVLHSNNGTIGRESLIQHWVNDGLVDRRLEADMILENLICSNLLGISKGNKERTIHHSVFLYLMFQQEKSQLPLLIKPISGTSEPKTLEEWENSEMINLSETKVYVLPEKPRCYPLSTLFLQRNNKLREIPPSFFSHMPNLRVLNLSRTSIKSLPKSVSELINLQRLYLNNCELLMVLPPEVGELQHLEVLDLEGTELMDLPDNVKKLTRLTQLDLSFYEFVNDTEEKQSTQLIPSEVISNLQKLEELIINVDSDDKRWKVSVVDIIEEVCKLPELKMLKFYFPDVLHLGLFAYFRYKLRQEAPPLSFRFVVGHHAKRILVRLPTDAKFELQRHDNYLHYVNGERSYGTIKEVLRYTASFFLDRHTTIETLSEFGIINMTHLKCCVIGECNKLEVIIDRPYVGNQVVLNSLEYLYIYYMQNLKSFWEGPLQEQCLSKLKSITFRTCPKLTNLFTAVLLSKLVNLEEITLDDCSSLESIVLPGPSAGSNFTLYLPQLKRISLCYLPKLISISTGLVWVSNLDFISIYDCPKLMDIEGLVASSAKLRKITGEMSWWEALQWSRMRDRSSVEKLFVPFNE